MSLDALRERLPAYAKDLSLNLSSLANETVLDDEQKWGAFVASAHAVGQADTVRAIEAAARAAGLSDDALAGAKAAAAIMGMNNVYYRALHLMQNPEYRTMPARLRMNVIANPGVDKARLRAVVHGRLGDQRLRHVPGRPRGRTAQARRPRRPDPGRPAHRRGGQRRQPRPRRRVRPHPGRRLTPRLISWSIWGAERSFSDGALRPNPGWGITAADEPLQFVSFMSRSCEFRIMARLRWRSGNKEYDA